MQRPWSRNEIRVRTQMDAIQQAKEEVAERRGYQEGRGWVKRAIQATIGHLDFIPHTPGSRRDWEAWE
jgi:hypothetical protein